MDSSCDSVSLSSALSRLPVPGLVRILIIQGALTPNGFLPASHGNLSSANTAYVEHTRILEFCSHSDKRINNVLSTDNFEDIRESSNREVKAC